MRQTPEQFHDAAMIAAMQAIVGKVPLGEKYNTPQSIQDHEYVVQAVCNGASDYATALLAHRMIDYTQPPPPAQPAQPEQRERWFGFVGQAATSWRFGGKYANGRYCEHGEDQSDSVYTLNQCEQGAFGFIELSPATGLPLEQDEAKPDARAVVEECRKALSSAVTCGTCSECETQIHAALARAREFLEKTK